MNLKLLMTIIIASSLTSFAFAEQPAQKEAPKKYLEGTHVPGAGYKIIFPETKSQLEVSGYTNIDIKATQRKKIDMPYFRFYVNGKSDEKWSFSTRFDYTNSWALSKASDIPSNKKYGTYTPYFARAYTTYRHNDNFSVDIGRIINQSHRFDVINDFGYDVGLGSSATFRMDDFYSNLTFTYNDDAQQMSDTHHLEYWTLGGRADYTFQLIGGLRLNAGLAFFTDAGYTGTKSLDLKPHLYLTTKDLMGLYVINQFAARGERQGKWDTTTSSWGPDKVAKWENYFEVGLDVLEWMSADMYLHSENNGAANEETAHNVGLEVYMKVNDHCFILPTGEIGNITKANGATEYEYASKVRIGYNF